MDDLLGSFTSLLLLPIAGCESAIGLMLILQFYPKKGTISLSIPIKGDGGLTKSCDI